MEGQTPAAAPTLRPLSPTERQVLVLTAEGCTLREIAKQLGRSPKTVDGHRVHMYRKLGISSTAEAARMAVALGLVPVEVLGGSRPEAVARKEA